MVTVELSTRIWFRPFVNMSPFIPMLATPSIRMKSIVLSAVSMNTLLVNVNPVEPPMSSKADRPSNALPLPSSPATESVLNILPVKTFAPYACSYRVDALTYKPARFAPEVLDILRARRPYAASVTTDNMLASLAESDSLSECSLACGEDGRTVGALVWALHNRHLHILAYGGSGSDTMTSRALITSVLEPARRYGAEWIDLALPRRFDAWFDGLAKLPGVDVAIEERIALRHPIVN